MTGGTVTLTRKPLVPLTIFDDAGVRHTISLVLDTGFTGQVLLPERHVNRLGLTMDRSTEGHPVGGDFIHIPTGSATAMWQGQP